MLTKAAFPCGFFVLHILVNIEELKRKSIPGFFQIKVQVVAEMTPSQKVTSLLP
jgi:hypothetical protein